MRQHCSWVVVTSTVCFPGITRYTCCIAPTYYARWFQPFSIEPCTLQLHCPFTGLRQFTLVHLPQTQPHPRPLLIESRHVWSSSVMPSHRSTQQLLTPPHPTGFRLLQMPYLTFYPNALPVLTQRELHWPPFNNSWSPIVLSHNICRFAPFIHNSTHTITPHFTPPTLRFLGFHPTLFEQHFGGPLAITDDRLMCLSF